MKAVKRGMVLTLTIIMLCCTLSVGASASVWRTGDFNQSASKWTPAHTVTLTDSNRTSTVSLYAYTCERGTGHSGDCKNSKRAQGLIYCQIKCPGGTWRTITPAGYPQELPISNYVTPQICLKGVKSYQIRLKLYQSKQYQHWVLEGKSNVKAIS